MLTGRCLMSAEEAGELHEMETADAAS